MPAARYPGTVFSALGNFRPRALDTAIREINAKTNLQIQLGLLERSRHGRVPALSFAIKAQAVPNGHFHRRRKM
jgi:hypothetical protein